MAAVGAGQKTRDKKTGLNKLGQNIEAKMNQSKQCHSDIIGQVTKWPGKVTWQLTAKVIWSQNEHAPKLQRRNNYF